MCHKQVGLVGQLVQLDGMESGLGPEGGGKICSQTHVTTEVAPWGGTSKSSEISQTWVQILASPGTSCVTLGTCFHPCELQLPIL